MNWLGFRRVFPPSHGDSFIPGRRYLGAIHIGTIAALSREKDALAPSGPKKQFVSGEGFPYLGRAYRLLLVDDQDVPVKLERGRFKMLRAAAEQGGAHMVRWYSERGQPWLEKRVERFQRRVGVEASAVTVQDLGYRWGSCGKGGRLFFHWPTVLLPPPVIEYVVVHELVHLLEAHHTPAFWTRVERAMPDFAGRKQCLSEKGSALWML